MEETLKIQKLVLEIKVDTEEEAQKINDNINEFIESYLLPELEKQLNTIVENDNQQTIKNDLIINKLNLTLNSNVSNLNNNLCKNVGTQFKKELKKVIAEASSKERDLNKNEIYNFVKQNSKAPFFFNENSKQAAALLHFLKTGLRPWWADSKTMEGIFEINTLKALYKNNVFIGELTKLLRSSKPQKRLILQFTNSYKKALYNTLCKTNTNSTPAINNELFKKIETLKHSEIFLLWNVLFSSLYSSHITKTNNLKFTQLVYHKISTIHNKSKASHNSQLKDDFMDHFTWKNLNSLKENKTTEKPKLSKNPNDLNENKIDKTKENHTFNGDTNTLNKQTTNDKQGQTLNEGTLDLFITEKSTLDTITNNNAPEVNVEEGQIFNHVGILLLYPFLKYFFNKIALLSNDNLLTDPELAVHILHYIVTGNTQSPECDMSFEKYLCNIHIETPINRERIITAEHKKEVALLFKAVKSNWSSIAQFSVIMIQNEFLKRPGKLIDINEGAKIIVERRGLDILMEKMDWGIGLIKLPWKDEFIYVNW